LITALKNNRISYGNNGLGAYETVFIDVCRGLSIGDIKRMNDAEFIEYRPGTILPEAAYWIE